MAKTALLVIADGTEEIEAVITADILRRAGTNVTIVGLSGSKMVNCSRSVQIKPDLAFLEVVKNVYDVIVLPGGQPGTNNLAESFELGEMIKNQFKSGRLLAAICAAPLILKANKIALGSMLTSHPTVKQQLLDAGYEYSEDRVVVSNNLVTSRAPGTAFEFALKIVDILHGSIKLKEISAPLLHLK